MELNSYLHNNGWIWDFLWELWRVEYFGFHRDCATSINFKASVSIINTEVLLISAVTSLKTNFLEEILKLLVFLEENFSKICANFIAIFNTILRNFYKRLVNVQKIFFKFYFWIMSQTLQKIWADFSPKNSPKFCSSKVRITFHRVGCYEEAINAGKLCKNDFKNVEIIPKYDFPFQKKETIFVILTPCLVHLTLPHVACSHKKKI